MAFRGIRFSRSGVTALAYLGALVAAFVAQYLFTGEAFTRFKDSSTWVWVPRYSAGAALLVVAVALAVWFGRRDESEPAPPSVEARTATLAEPLIRRAVWSAVGLNVAAIALLVVWGESRAVRMLWILAIVSLALPLLFTTYLARRDGPRGVSGDADRWSPWEGPALLALTFAGLLLRLYRVTELPEQVDNDVALMGVETLKVMRNLDPRWFGLASSDHSFSIHQIQALGLRLFGRDHFGLVMPSVLAGTLTLPVLYRLAREAFSRRVALISTFLLATDYTHIHFSRIMFGPTATLLLCLSLAHLFRALRTGRAFNWAAGGLAMGLSLLTYDSSRVGPVIVLAALAGLALVDRKSLRAQLPGWGLFLSGAFVGFGPMTGFMIRDFGSFLGRGRTVMIWSPGVLKHAMSAYNVASIPAVLFEQVRRTFLSLHLYGDGSPHFAIPRPAIGALAAALCVLGTGVALARIRRLPHLLVLAWVTLTFVLGGILTSDPPYWPHLNIALPAIALLGGLGADRLTRALSPFVPGGRVPVLAAMGLALLAAGWHNWTIYHEWVDDNAGPRIEATRFLRTLPRETYVFLVSDEIPWDEYCFRFFNRGMAGRNVTPDELLAGREQLPDDRPYTAVIFGHKEVVSALRRALPLSKIQAHPDQDGELLFTSVTVIPTGFQPGKPQEPARPGLLPLALVAIAAAAGIVYRSVHDSGFSSRSAGP